MLAGRLNGKSRPTGWRPPTNIGTPNLHPVRLLTAKVPELQTQDSFIALANYGKPGEIQGQHALQTRANWVTLRGGKKKFKDFFLKKYCCPLNGKKPDYVGLSNASKLPSGMADTIV